MDIYFTLFYRFQSNYNFHAYFCAIKIVYWLTTFSRKIE